MTVKELIGKLQEMDGGEPVKFVYNFGDFCGTLVAADVDKIAEGETTWSDYFNKDTVLDVDEIDDENVEFVDSAVLLS